MASILAYADPEQAARLRVGVEAAARKLGLDPAEIGSMNQPMIVRMVDDSDAGSPGELSRALNEAVIEIASAIGEDNTLAAALTNPTSARRIVKAMRTAQALTEADSQRYLTSDGMPTPEGRAVIERTLLGAVVGDVRTLNDLRPSDRNTLLRSMGPIMRLRRIGQNNPGMRLDVDRLFGDALEMLTEYQASGAPSIRAFLDEPTVTPQPWRKNRDAVRLAVGLDGLKPTEFSRAMNAVASAADDQATGQVGMFAGDAASPTDWRQGLIDAMPEMPANFAESTHAIRRTTGTRPNAINVSTGSAAATMGSRDSGMPDFVRKAPPETRQGRRLVRRIKNDKAGKVGMRSINVMIEKVIDTLILARREQTSSTNPAHYARLPHIIRTRNHSAPWMFHEHGHAISALVREKNPKFLKEHAGYLNKLAKRDGSMASAHTPEEGFAEFVRLFITDARLLDETQRNKVMASIEAASPKSAQVMRDAARAFDAHVARPRDVVWRSGQNDYAHAPAHGQIKRFVEHLATRYISRSFVPDFAVAEVHRQVRRHTAGRRAAWAKSDELNSATMDTAADLKQAYNALNHIGQFVLEWLEGRRGKSAGGSVYMTGPAAAGDMGRAPIDIFDQATRDALEAAGFRNVPQGQARHGDEVQLAPMTLRAAVEKVNRNDFETFETYVQFKATVERHNAHLDKASERAARGEPETEYKHPMMGYGVKAEVLAADVARWEKENPAWREAADNLEQIAEATLLLNMMSGELDLDAVVKIREAFDFYAPLTRIGERGTKALVSGATDAPRGSPRRQRGSETPAEPLLNAMARRIQESLHAYYWNRFMIAPIAYADRVSATKGLPAEAQWAAERIALPLKLDNKKMATLRPNEQRQIIFEYIKDHGHEFDMPQELLDKLTEEDINVISTRNDGTNDFKGYEVWRQVKPNAINIVAPVWGGSRHYYQINDPNLFALFSTSDQVNEVVRFGQLAFQNANSAQKRAITQNVVFTVRNIARDALTATLFTKEAKGLVPGFYHVHGAVRLMTGKTPKTLADPELLSRQFRHVTAEDFVAQRSKAMVLLTENIVDRGWKDMSILAKGVSMPGMALALAAKPFELGQVVTGQRALATASESAPRVAAFMTAKARGASDEAAQLMADSIVGRFSERPLSPNAWAVWRFAGFLNAAMQIFGQTLKEAGLGSTNPARQSMVFGLKLANIALWTGGAWALTRLLSGPERREKQKERTEYERLSHADVAGLSIPFDYGLSGGVQALVWNSLDEIYNDAPPASRRAIVRKALQTTLPFFSMTDIMPFAPKAGFEVSITEQGVSTFRGENILPDYMRYMEPPERAFDTTPELYRWFGRMANVSPAKAEYFVRNGLSVQMADTVRLIEAVQNGISISNDEAADLPMIGRMFTRDPVGWASRSVRDVQEIEREAAAIRSSIRKLREANQSPPEDVMILEDRLRKLTPAVAAMRAVNRRWELIRQENKKPPAERDRAAIRRWKEEMTEAGRTAIMEMEEMPQTVEQLEDQQRRTLEQWYDE